VLICFWFYCRQTVGTPPVVEKLGEVDEIKQFSTTDEYRDYRSITGIGFTAQHPTRDLELNRTTVASVARQLGIVLSDENFKVDDSLLWAAVPECNLPGDPIDA
jgi:hypothetical protein